MRNYDCSEYPQCLTEAALKNVKDMQCGSCQKGNIDGRLSASNPALLRELALQCLGLLLAVFPEPPEAPAIPHPKEIRGWRITWNKRLNYFRGYKKIGGKIRYAYMGKTLDGAESKILAREKICRNFYDGTDIH